MVVYYENNEINNFQLIGQKNWIDIQQRNY